MTINSSSILKITATELRVCQCCPRLLAYQKRGEKNVWAIGSGSSGASFGKLFHEHIAEKFHEDAAKENLPELTEALKGGAAGLKTRLSDLVQTRYFVPFLAGKGAALNSERLMALARGTEFWIQCLAEFLSGVPSLLDAPEKNLAAVFRPPEQTMRASYPYPDGKAALDVSGRYDALLFNPDAKEAALFEFKGFKSANVTVELSQALVYAWLVYTSTGIIPSVTLIYLEDDAPASFPAGHVKKMLDNLPHLFDTVRLVLENRRPIPKTSDQALCGQCRFNARCGADRVEPYTLTGPGAATLEALIDALKELNVFVTGEGYIDGPRFVRLKVKPDSGKRTIVRKIENTARDLQVAMNLPSPPLIQAQSGYVSVDIPKEKGRVLLMEELLKMSARSRPESGAAFPLGLNIDGSVFWVDLESPSTTSILIGGTSGSGKSELLRSIVVGSLLCAPSDELSFTLIDPKRVTFSDMKNLRALEEGAVLYDSDAAMKALSVTIEEMERRYVLMERAGVQDVSEHNKNNRTTPERLKRRIVIVDEYADIMTADRQTRTDLETFVQRICQKGRAAGIHLILATQRPDAKVVTGVIKANLQLRIALKVISQKNSEIILGEGVGQANYLLGHGDMLAGGSVAPQRVQAPLSSAGLLGPEFWK